MNVKNVEEAIRDLRNALGAEKVRTEEFARDCYRRDMTLHYMHYSRPAVIVMPDSTEEVQKVVQIANRLDVPITPVGAMTSCWGANENRGGIVVDLCRMNRLLDVDIDNLTFTAEAGANILSIKTELNKSGFTYPTHPLYFGPITLGAEVAKDTGGEMGAMYGHISKRIIGLEVVLGNGDVLQTGSSNVIAGIPHFIQSGLPDMTQLFVGSEGAYGIITKVTMKMQMKPVKTISVDVKFPGDVAGYTTATSAAQEIRKHVNMIRSGHVTDYRSAWGKNRYVTKNFDVSPEADKAAMEQFGSILTLESDSFVSAEEAQMKSDAAVEIAKSFGGIPGSALDMTAFFEKQENGDASMTHYGWAGRNNSTEAVTRTPYNELGRLYERFNEMMDEAGWPKVYSKIITACGDDCTIPFFGLCRPMMQDCTLEEWNENSRIWNEKILPPWIDFAFEYGSIPYNIGTMWRVPALFDRLDPSYRAYIMQIKKLFDPNNIMHPGVSVFEEVY